MNQLRTARVLSSPSLASAMAAKRSGRSHQYAGNSVNDVGERMKGGAVKEERSPEKDAMDLRNEVQLPRCDAGTASPAVSDIVLEYV